MSDLEVLTCGGNAEENTKSNCSGDEVEIELFSTGRLPWIEAEAPRRAWLKWAGATRAKPH